MMLDELQTILSTMAIPTSRRELTLYNLMWLQRNLRINNGNHNDIDAAMSMIKSLIKSHA